MIDWTDITAAFLTKMAYINNTEDHIGFDYHGLSWHDSVTPQLSDIRQFNAFACGATCLVAFHESDSACYVSYRGTTEIRDVIINLWLSTTPSDFGEGSFHSGFFHQHACLWERVLAYIMYHCPKTVVFTGHSLGGAIATIAASKTKTVFPDKDVRVASFGCPRVGDLAFRDFFSSQGIDHKRFVNHHDPISHVPSFLRWRHVGDLYRFVDGKLEVTPRDEWSPIDASWKHLLYVLDHSVESYLKLVTQVYTNQFRS